MVVALSDTIRKAVESIIRDNPPEAAIAVITSMFESARDGFVKRLDEYDEWQKMPALVGRLHERAKTCLEVKNLLEEFGPEALPETLQQMATKALADGDGWIALMIATK